MSSFCKKYLEIAFPTFFGLIEAVSKPAQTKLLANCAKIMSMTLSSKKSFSIDCTMNLKIMICWNYVKMLRLFLISAKQSNQAMILYFIKIRKSLEQIMEKIVAEKAMIQMSRSDYSCCNHTKTGIAILCISSFQMDGFWQRI